MKSNQIADSKTNEQEKKINFYKKDFDEFKLSSINTNNDENVKSLKTKSDTITSG